MPNWCDCELNISGPEHAVEKFLETMQTESNVFDFNQLIPYPEHLRELDDAFEEWLKKPDEARGEPPKTRGRSWCIANWGTKWNSDKACLQQRSPRVVDGRTMLSVAVNFNTAWSPPLPVIECAAKRFPELSFELRYFERAMEFNGILICERGEVIRDEDGPYFGWRGG